MRARASMPLWAVTTSKYSAVSLASRSFTFESMSSTTRTRAVMTCPTCYAALSDEATDRVEEAGDGDGFGDIGLAPALADDLLVTLHRERGNGHDRDGLQ